MSMFNTWMRDVYIYTTRLCTYLVYMYHEMDRSGDDGSVRREKGVFQTQRHKHLSKAQGANVYTWLDINEGTCGKRRGCFCVTNLVCLIVPLSTGALLYCVTQLPQDNCPLNVNFVL